MTTIDDSLYSRQIYAIGKTAMNNLSNTSILISGMTGLGVEVAKCLILYGVKSVTIHDTSCIREKELSSNYYATIEDIGKFRTDVVAKQLTKLNPYVNVTTDKSDLNDMHFKNHQVVVVCDQLPISQIRINKMARRHNTKYILATTIGVMGSIFCDFGESFVVDDVNGENVKTGILTEIQDNVFFSSEPHQMYVDDKIEISMDNKIILDEVIKVHSVTSFELKHTKIKYKLLTNAMFTEIKKPEKFIFNNLAHCIKNPSFSNVVSNDPERQQLLHNYYMTLNIFINQYEKFPSTDNDIDHILRLMGGTINEQHTEIIKKLCYTSAGKCCPIDSIIASITAQEAIKASAKKYTPINQWLYMDFTDIIQNINELPIQHGRYASQMVIFGEQFQQKLQKSHVFIVGAGAIGCELLKNLAMMGIGKITITDMDKIEKSNLNRQFLFKYTDIGKFKSDSAKNAILNMNPGVNVISQQNKVSNETINIYTDEFFKDVTCVMTALDNIEARKFVDYLCSMNACPMIDSGTLGTKGNTQIILPNKTETYGLTQDPEEKSIPVCTLKSFPYLIEHCIQYARDLFDGLFVKAPSNFIRYKQNPEIIKNMTKSDALDIINDIKFINDNNVSTSKECISFAYKLWHIHFRDQIHDIITKYPKDTKTKDGAIFWSGTKQFPTLEKFKDSVININFIKATANLWADMFNLPHVTDKQIILFVKKATEPYIQQKIDDNEDNYKVPTSSNIDISPLEFEKDNDDNFHIDFIHSVSTLRALNYGIKPVDKFTTKGIAGKIIPALITTTSLVSGLATLELLKIINNVCHTEKYTNSYVNLALPFFGFSEPNKAKVNKMGSLEYSLCPIKTMINPTLENIITYVNDSINEKTIQLMSVTYFGSFIYNSLNRNHIKRFPAKIKDIVEEITEQIAPPEFVIYVSCDNTNDDTIVYEPVSLRIILKD